MVGILDIAAVDGLRLYKTSRQGEWRAHCPVCKDTGRSFHLYVSSERDAFICFKCGASGGAVAFHAWLQQIDFDTAKTQLYPPTNQKRKRKVHPGERLTSAQRLQLGFPLRRPSPVAPGAFDQKTWNRYRRRTFDWMWREWREHEHFEREQTKRLQSLLLQAQREEIQNDREEGPRTTVSGDIER